MKILNQDSRPPEYQTRRFFFFAREKKSGRNGTVIHVRVLQSLETRLPVTLCQGPLPQSAFRPQSHPVAMASLQTLVQTIPPRSVVREVAVVARRYVHVVGGTAAGNAPVSMPWSSVKHFASQDNGAAYVDPKTGRLNGNSSSFLLVAPYKFRDNDLNYTTYNSKHFPIHYSQITIRHCITSAVV